jgi:lysine-N-methylase
MKQKPGDKTERKKAPPRGAATGLRVALPTVRGAAPEASHFACRECPARCCRLPWGIRFGEEERERYLAEPFVIERAGPAGLEVLGRGMLPTRAEEGRLQCVFLDADELCSLQKRFGHEYLPRPCQAFPFGFVSAEDGATLAQLSQLCPSIRDDRGEPVGPELAAKLAQGGGATRMSQRMLTRAGVMLTRPQFLRVAERWSDALAEETSPAELLARLVDESVAFEEALVGGEHATDAAVEAALRTAEGSAPAAFAPRRRSSYQTRLLLAFLLGNLCFPSRLRQPNRVSPPVFLEGARALANKLVWLLERGSVDLLFLPKPIALGQVRKVPRFLGGEHGGLVRDYLRLVLARRQIFAEPRHLLAVLLDLCIGTVLVSRFARCRAVAFGRAAVDASDVREGIGVAELLLLHHAALSEQPGYMKRLRWLLLVTPEKLRGVLASEA